MNRCRHKLLRSVLCYTRWQCRIFLQTTPWAFLPQICLTGTMHTPPMHISTQIDSPPKTLLPQCVDDNVEPCGCLYSKSAIVYSHVFCPSLFMGQNSKAQRSLSCQAFAVFLSGECVSVKSLPKVGNLAHRKFLNSGVGVLIQTTDHKCTPNGVPFRINNN